MKSFRAFLTEEELLLEKLIIFNNGAKYGQVVFMAAGAASGKGYVIKNYIESDKFKVLDVDRLKELVLSAQKRHGTHPSVEGLNLKKSEDVFTLHDYVEKKGLMKKKLAGLLNATTDTLHLPNLIFDITLKNIAKLHEAVIVLQEVGYQLNNMHLVAVITDYQIAIQQNNTRDRVVPADILLTTHVGATKTLWDIIRGAIPPTINGEIVVVLNNKENTVYYTDANGRPIRGTTGNLPVKDFTYIRIKKTGQPYASDKHIQDQLWSWIRKNAPKEAIEKLVSTVKP